MQVNRRITISIIALTTASVLLVGGVAVPSIMSIGALQRKIDESNAAIEKRYLMRQMARDSVSSLEASRNAIADIRKIAINEGQELDFIDALDKVQSRTGVQADVTLETVNMKIISDWERDIPIVIKASGDYRDLIRFLDGLEKMPYFVNLNTVSIRAEQTASGAPTGLTAAELRGSVYWISKNAPAFVVSGSVSDKPTE